MPQIIKINGDLYIVRRNMNVEYEPLGPEWNKISPLHKTFKQNDRLFFCELIEEAEIIEEVVGNSTN